MLIGLRPIGKGKSLRMETDMADMNGFIKRRKSDSAVRHGHKNMINLQMNDILNNEKSVIIIIIRYKNIVE